MKINKFRNFFLDMVLNQFSSFISKKKVDLLIYDDIFPHPISGFRLEEFNVLLTEFDSSIIISEPISYRLINTGKEKHQFHIDLLTDKIPAIKGKVLTKKDSFIKIRAKLFYCLFLNNILRNLQWLEKCKIPFVFTLYPGGGFLVNDTDTDANLKRVFTSPMFRKVIVTQKFTKEYLLNKQFCKQEAIEYIYGGVVPQISLSFSLSNKKTYSVNKSTFDICFCAAKYTDKGVDKGYDLFVKFAKQISPKYDFVKFHIIGGFDLNDIAINNIHDNIKFYGYLDFDNLRKIYLKMDVIVSPNRPFVLSKGAFDGFPLGTVVEAVLNGVVALVTDELKQNTLFKNHEELVIIEANVDSVEKEVVNLINYPEKLSLISKKGREKFLKVYSNNVQLSPRINLLRQELNKY